jgi:uncharacterized protein YbjQ (UPF0145 family)
MLTRDEVADHRTVNGKKVALSDAERDTIAADRTAMQDEIQRVEAEMEKAEKRAAAVRAMQDRLLAEALIDPNAPAEIKAYAETISTGGGR